MRKHIFLISEQKDIFVTLNLFDDLFEPALSLRIEDLDKYAKKLEDNANKGMLKIKLEVLKKNNKAIRFYERNEFRFCEVSSSESIYMIRDL